MQTFIMKRSIWEFTTQILLPLLRNGINILHIHVHKKLLLNFINI